jgi:hypothetical protein
MTHQPEPKTEIQILSVGKETLIKTAGGPPRVPSHEHRRSAGAEGLSAHWRMALLAMPPTPSDP